MTTHFHPPSGTLCSADDGYPANELVELPAGYHDHPWWRWDGAALVPDVEACRAQMRAAVTSRRDLAEHSGCMTAKGRVQTDPISQHKMSGAVAGARELGEAFSTIWTMEDNSRVPHDHLEMRAAGLAVLAHVDACHQVMGPLKDQIAAAETMEQLLAIDIYGAPWPDRIELTEGDEE